MPSNKIRTFALLLAASAGFVAASVVFQRQASAQVFMPYGAQRGRIVIRPWVHKVWWGNGLTPYGAATIQYGFGTLESIATNPNVLSTVGALAGAGREPPPQVNLQEFQQLKDRVARLEEQMQARAAAKEGPPSGTPPVLALEGAAYFKLYSEVIQDAKALKAKAQAAKNDGASTQAKIKDMQAQLEQAHKTIDEGNKLLQSLIDGLDPVTRPTNPQ